MASVVVVGGGLAGLCAGWRLARAGHAVRVLEAEETAGGRMRTEPSDGFLLDRGAQFIASAYRNLHGVVSELGLADRVRPFESTGGAANAVLRDGRLHPADPGSPLRLLASPLLSPGAKLRLARLLFEAWRHRARIDPWHPERAAPIDDEDLAGWLRRVVGAEAAEYLITPAFSSTFDSDPEDLSAVFALQAIRFTSLGFRLQGLEGGVGLLTRSLAARLDVRTGARVRSVVPSADGVELRVSTPTGEEGMGADAAVVALPGSLVPGVCPALRDAERAFFAAVRYVRGMIVFLLFERAPASIPCYGVGFPRPEGLDLYGLACDHVKPGAAPPGAGLVNCALTAAAAARWWEASDEAVAAHALDELARTPIGRLAPARCVVHRWDPMLPQFRAGYTRALARFLGRSRGERSPRLAFAGDYLVGPYTEGACTSGLRAADALAAELGRT